MENTVYILLSIYPDWTSKMLRAVKRWRFTHASIGTKDTAGKFYSMVTKGFHIEDPQKYPTVKRQEIPCELYCIEVPDEIYSRVHKTIDYHLNHAASYKYSFTGLAFCLAHIAVKLKNKYFCSQLIAEILETAHVISLDKPSSLCVPDDLAKLKNEKLMFRGSLREMTCTPEAMLLTA